MKNNSDFMSGKLPIPKEQWNGERKRRTTFSFDLADSWGDKRKILTKEEGRRRERCLMMGLVDPLGSDFFLTVILAPVICSEASKETKQDVGSFFVNALENLKVDDLCELFERIVALKKNHGQLKHRNWYAVFAFHQYIENFGKVPSKMELRMYMMENIKIFKDQPGPENKKGWTRLWKESGLGGMINR